MHYGAPHTSTMVTWLGSQMGCVPGKGEEVMMESAFVGSSALLLALCLLTLEFTFH